jgi:thymidine kinase
VPGKLELMMGPMRSNKTAELLRRAEMRRQYAKQNVLVLKPSDDTKGGPGVVESRNPQRRRENACTRIQLRESVGGSARAGG